jgi:hypothetical protein
VRYPQSVWAYLNRSSQTAFENLDGYGFPTRISADGRFIYLTRFNAPAAVGYWDALLRSFVPIATQAQSRTLGGLYMTRSLSFGALHSDQQLDPNGPPPTTGLWDIFSWKNSTRTFQIINRNSSNSAPGAGARPVRLDFPGMMRNV